MKRTPLVRKTELARGDSPLRRKAAMQRVASAKRTVAKQKRQRDTGPDDATKRVLWDRARGHCELCGRDLQGGFPFSRHHRRPRGMGGSSVEWVNDLTNLLLLCGSATTPHGCHAYIESHRAEAYDAGWLIRYASEYMPWELPVLLHMPPLNTMDACDDGGVTYHFREAGTIRLVYLTRFGTYAEGVA